MAAVPSEDVCDPFNSKSEISTPFYMLKRTNEKGRQSLWGFPRPEITGNVNGQFLLVNSIRSV